jgi:hypothetical protein
MNKITNETINCLFLKVNIINQNVDDLNLQQFLIKSDKLLNKLNKINKSSKINKIKNDVDDDDDIIGADQNDNFLRFIPPYNRTCTVGNNCSKPAAFKSKTDSKCYCWLHIHSISE